MDAKEVVALAATLQEHTEAAAKVVTAHMERCANPQAGLCGIMIAAYAAAITLGVTRDQIDVANVVALSGLDDMTVQS